ncbi:uncharacterized protein PV09_07410 [Verruconis gallopava]|uniref:Uncharacterized protein n=1 Tax=Verruconis gallopava TaxID=253628 RepID=A0A0D2A2Y0_9PEZI|nr:uncharacterized protein PV09_07410 [Verruconis gallopava]KIW01123.1 hypothetical protein PV09_07410 [Verruconis gallopava]
MSISLVEISELLDLIHHLEHESSTTEEFLEAQVREQEMALLLEQAIRESIQTCEASEKIDERDEDDEADLKRALELSLQPDVAKDEIKDDDISREDELDEETRLAIELSLKQDDETSDSANKGKLRDVVVDFPSTNSSVGHQHASSQARREDYTGPMEVDTTETGNKRATGKEFQKELHSPLECILDLDGNLMQECSCAGAAESACPAFGARHTNILSNLEIEFAFPGEFGVITHLPQAPECSWSIGSRSESAVPPRLGITIVPVAAELAIADPALRKRRMSTGLTENRPLKCVRKADDPIEDFLCRLDEVTLQLSSTVPVSPAIVDVMEQAKQLRRRVESLPTSTSGIIAGHNARILRLAELVLEATSFLITPPKDKEHPVQFFEFLNKAQHSAGAFFAHHAHRPEEEQAFKLVDSLVSAMVNEVMKGTALHEKYQTWQADQTREAAAKVNRMGYEVVLIEMSKVQKNIMSMRCGAG